MCEYDWIWSVKELWDLNLIFILDQNCLFTLEPRNVIVTYTLLLCRKYVVWSHLLILFWVERRPELSIPCYMGRGSSIHTTESQSLTKRNCLNCLKQLSCRWEFLSCHISLLPGPCRIKTHSKTRFLCTQCPFPTGEVITILKAIVGKFRTFKSL